MLTTLRRIVHGVEESSSFQDALGLLVREVREALGTEVCSAYLLNPQGDSYVLVATGRADGGLDPVTILIRRLALAEQGGDNPCFAIVRNARSCWTV